MASETVDHKELFERAEGFGGGFVALLRPYTSKVSFVVFLLGLLAITNMALPFTIKLLIDNVFPSDVGSPGNWHLLWLILPGLVVIYLLRNLLFFSSRMVSVHVSEDLCFRLRRRLFEHLQQLSLSYYKSNQPGKVASRLMDDTYKIQSFIQDKLPTLLLSVLMFQTLLVVLYVTNWRLALASTIILPFHLFTYYRFKRSMRRSQSESQENLASAYGDLIERFLGIEVVKGFAAEERESLIFNKNIDRSRQSQIRTQRLHFIQKVIADLLIGIGTVFLLGFGAMEVKHGMSAGTFFMFFGYVGMLYPAVVDIMGGTSHLSKTTACVDRVLDLLKEPIFSFTAASSGAQRLHDLKGDVEFRDVSYTYDSDGEPVLNSVSFRLEPGEHVSIVGPSGSGKSTLAYLIPRFLDATSGEVYIDGEPMRELPTNALRSHMSIAFQEVFLFNTTIYENLRYARPDASMDDIREVCRITGADHFIDRLPDGYDTQLGTSGVELSRGEKQRITLARSILKRPKILILDEATASLDRESSEEVIQAISKYMVTSTLIMITHERNLIRMTDRVLHIERGTLSFDGATSAYLGKAPTAENRRPQAESKSTMASASAVWGNTRLLAVTGFLAAMLLAGCTSVESETERSLTMEEPRGSSGLLSTSEPPPSLDDMARDIADARPPLPPAEQSRPAPPAPAGETVTETLSYETGARRHDDEIAGRMINLPSMSKVEIVELLDNLVLKLATEHGYQVAGAEAAALPPVPARIQSTKTLHRTINGRTRWVRLGYIRSLTQAPNLWIQGIVDAGVDEAAALEVADAARVAEGLLSSREGGAGSFIPWQQLDVDVITLSYIDSGNAVRSLGRLGFNTLGDDDPISSDIDFHQLPVVIRMPPPDAESVGLVGEQQVARDKLGLTLMPSVASKLPTDTVASPTSQLLIFYHPAFPEQLTRVHNAIDSIVDIPARQIFVEGLVLEISEEGMKELGVTWQAQEGEFDVTAGNLTVEGVVAGTLNATISRDAGLPDNWRAQLRALIVEGKAEVLSRPSILALDNRQATIRVGRDVPIATSGTIANNNKLSFTFHYIPTGILLNIRPRIADDDNSISMLVDTTVSGTVAGQDLQIRDTEGNLLAQAPTISIRRVQTYARIGNNTPFIVGGLVSRETTRTEQKVPLLGDLPYIGRAFTSSRDQSIRREVIIVLTPYILPTEHYVARSMPKDEARFDSFGRKLFRDFYRLRAEDIYDLDFLTSNQRLATYRQLVAALVRRNVLLAERDPFEPFAKGRVPGSQVLVHRMAYDLIRGLEVDNQVDIANLLYLNRPDSGGYGVSFVNETLADMGDGSDPMSFFSHNPGKALALTFSYDRERLQQGSLISEPIPAVRLVPCADKDAWRTLLWKLNQRDDNGQRHYTILIRAPEDLDRLRRAIVLKQAMTLNFGDSEPGLEQFTIGKILLIPELDESQNHLIDADVARYFFNTEHYYDIVNQRLESYLRELDSALREPDIQPYLEGLELP